MKIRKLIDWENIEATISSILDNIHKKWPIYAEDMEILSYAKKFHPSILWKYEHELIYLMWLFYKISNPQTFIEKIYSIFAEVIKEECWWKAFTPVQADAYKKIQTKTYFSFSAPTSSWKSFLFRELILETQGDIIIVVPSRALISEYMYEVLDIVKDDKKVLVLPFIENINKSKTNRRIFIITPERWVELFKLKDWLNVELFLFDEAHISEELIRWMQFDSFVRRSDKLFPNAKKVFAHPFVDNPDAQIKKHKFDENLSAFDSYKYLSVWKIFLCIEWSSYKYFSPYLKNPQKQDMIMANDLIEEIVQWLGTVLIYISKEDIYSGEYIEKYWKYIDLCGTIATPWALDYIEELKWFIGASDSEREKHSLLIEMMEKWIVIHHGSIPLKARYIVENFINDWFAKICFSTATLLQGVNMPFKAVLIDNFKFSWVSGEHEKILWLKNLIWRAGRSTNTLDSNFEYGYVLIKKGNIKTFCARLNTKVSISEVSKLNEERINIQEDMKDIYDAFRENSFDDNLMLPNNQITRIKEYLDDEDLKFILDTLIWDNDTIISWKGYQLIKKSKKDKIKFTFQKIFKYHLRRNELKSWEKSVLSAAIAILLWKIQWKTFKEIVWLRLAYVTNKDKQLEIKRSMKWTWATNEEIVKSISDIKLKFTQPAQPIPDISLQSRYSLFKEECTIKDFQYDTIVYDTYDYIDKVLTYSLTNPLAATFRIFYEKTNDSRAKAMENYIRYGTNDSMEIMLLRYWFSFEEIEWIKPCVLSINEDEITFDKVKISILEESEKQIIQRFL